MLVVFGKFSSYFLHYSKQTYLQSVNFTTVVAPGFNNIPQVRRLSGVLGLSQHYTPTRGVHYKS